MSRVKKNLGGRPRSRPHANKFDREVGARIKVRREALGMSTNDLALVIEKSASQAYRYQTGDCTLDSHVLSAIASALGCKISDLVDGIRVK